MNRRAEGSTGDISNARALASRTLPGWTSQFHHFLKITATAATIKANPAK